MGATTGTAATAMYAALAVAYPGVPVVVAGVPPCKTTMSAGNVACNSAVRASALAAPNVIGFIDMLAGQWVTPTASGPLEGQWVTGTGKLGTLVGDGNADNLMAPDDVHPWQYGHDVLGRRLARGIAVLLGAQ